MSDPTPEVKPVDPNVEGGEPSTPEEKVASPEVKPESNKPGELEPAPVEPVEKPVEKIKDDGKLKEQVDNLNVALKEERDNRKGDRDKIGDLETRLGESQETISKLKTVFTPEEEPEVTSEYLTPEQAQEIWDKKDEERKTSDLETKRAATIKTDVINLEKEWDGKDGKPKYSDSETLQWQKENEKLYLMPKEAFTAMKRNEIIDWEVKQRLSGKKKVENVEQPSTIPSSHEPAEKKLQTDKEVRDAVFEAMDKSEEEM